MNSTPSAILVRAVEKCYSTEFELVCACARVVPNAEEVASRAEQIEGEVGWQQVLRLAERHSVLPTVARNLGSHEEIVPAEIRRRLREAYESNVRRNLWFAAELRRISGHFEQQNVAAVPFKGVVLAESVYGDLGLRTFNDLDFLIVPEQLGSARRALGEIGYRPHEEFSPAEEWNALRAGYELPFSCKAGSSLVELQWRVLPYFCGVDLKCSELVERSVRIGLSGHEVRSLAPEDLVLVLSLHAAKHLWMRLLWIVDVAESLGTQKIDWTIVRSRANDLGIERIVGISLWLAREMLGTSIPDEAQVLIAGDAQIPILGRLFASRLAVCATYDFESLNYFRLFMATRERWSDQARYLWRLLWTPGSGDLEAIRLPRPLFPLYRLVRVVRLPRKLL